MNEKTAVIIVAAGSGERIGGTPKQYRDLGGRPVLAHSVALFLSIEAVSSVLVVINEAHRALYAAALSPHARLLPPVVGGATRQQSVLAGLKALETLAPDRVLIHDAARPFTTPALVEKIIAATGRNSGAVPALPVTDTIKQAPDGQYIDQTLNRAELFAVQTPQGFDFAALLAAHNQAAIVGPGGFTDDSAIAEWAGMPVVLVPGEPGNIKLTHPGDFAPHQQNGKNRMETRVGNGFDVHRFGPGKVVTLCGIKIDHTAGLIGHSDADAGLHVLTDALLGAMAAGDIGTHFPPSDEKWKNEPSQTFLGFAARMLAKRSGRIIHLDLTLICEMPKIAPHVAAMRQSVAEICRIGTARISIKATTAEKCGFIGRNEALAAMATATIELPAGEE
jgi:2-C-methyl-D-erythritol 4-phosphate cytidylyltransferase / 2-C-methyl-D-erythritol 2,4-cyclodiphosphate synthase